MSQKIIVRQFGIVAFESMFNKMEQFVAQRSADTIDEFWLLQHEPVYTQGYSCKKGPKETTDIPVVHTDRGGQITYHGPGQLVIYLLLDLKRSKLGIRFLVQNIEAAVITVLARLGIEGKTKKGAPGVYVLDKKVASLGIRVKRGYTYHGLSLNVDMDLSPFAIIDVCGYQGLEVTSLRELGIINSMQEIENICINELCSALNYKY